VALIGVAFLLLVNMYVKNKLDKVEKEQKKNTCPHCGKVTESEGRFCPHCGKER